MRELRAGALRLFWSRERERDHGGVLACAMIGITDLLLGVESVLDQGASGTLGLIVERLIDQRRNVGQLCLLEFGFQSESYFFIWRRAEKDFFPHFSLLWGARSHLIERDGVGNFHCLHTYLLIVLHTNQLKCL